MLEVKNSTFPSQAGRKQALAARHASWLVASFACCSPMHPRRRICPPPKNQTVLATYRGGGYLLPRYILPFYSCK